MGIVTCQIAVSLDGFVAGPDQHSLASGDLGGPYLQIRHRVER